MFTDMSMYFKNTTCTLLTQYSGGVPHHSSDLQLYCADYLHCRQCQIKDNFTKSKPTAKCLDVSFDLQLSNFHTVVVSD